MPVVSLENWNEFISSHPDAHFMQSGAWGELKVSFGWDVVRIINDSTGAQVLFRKLPFGFTIGYIPKGPTGRDLVSIWPEIDQICRAHHSIFLKVELDIFEDNAPIQTKDFPGFNLSKYNIQPPNTIIVDISGNEMDILQKMNQKTRYNIKLAARKGVTVRPWENISSFYKMMITTGVRDKFGVHSKEYFQRVYELFHPTGECELMAAFYDGQPIASILVFARGTRAWYVYGASSDFERNRMPAYLLQWEAIRWAKAQGCQKYDLWGIPDETEEELEAGFTQRNSGLWGVYRFKRGFGGKIRRNAQALDKIYIPWLYSFYLWRMAGRETY